MVFSSVVFCFYFLPAVLLCYFLLPGLRLRNAVLTAASLIFYLWAGLRTFPLILVSIALNYLLGLGAAAARRPRARRTVLAAAVVLNLGLLFYYKYFDYSVHLWNILAGRLAFLPTLEEKGIELPIGISFFTFQGMSYVIDVYRGKAQAQRNPGKLALYISFFPQLVAGPIVRYTDVSAALDSRRSTVEGFTHGLARFIIGLGKKVMIADVLAKSADAVFSMSLPELYPAMAWLGIVCYTLQIYFDFSGYSDMAIGMGEIFGFHFPENFRYPYRAVSMQDFWRRWHISLSSWFRDYVYIPLGGSRRGSTYLHLAAVFLLTGIWHGAFYTFVFWGVWHGFFVIAERILDRKFRFRLPAPLGWMFTLLVVLLGWVLFRSTGWRTALGFVRVLFGARGGAFNLYRVSHFLNPQTACTLAVGILASLGLHRTAADRIAASPRYQRSAAAQNIVAVGKYIGLLAVLFFSLAMIMNGNYSPFIYFRF